MACGNALERIRRRFGVKAYNGVKIKTKDGNVGVIVGAEGYTLKVFFEGTRKKENVDPEKVAYLGFSLK